MMLVIYYPFKFTILRTIWYRLKITRSIHLAFHKMHSCLPGEISTGGGGQGLYYTYI